MRCSGYGIRSLLFDFAQVTGQCLRDCWCPITWDLSSPVCRTLTLDLGTFSFQIKSYNATNCCSFFIISVHSLSTTFTKNYVQNVIITIDVLLDKKNLSTNKILIIYTHCKFTELNLLQKSTIFLTDFFQ